MSSIAKKPPVSRTPVPAERGISSKEEAQLWLRRFEAAEEIDRAAQRNQGPRPHWSIETALSLFEAARAAGFLSPSALRVRISEDEAVRGTWDRLRARLRK